MIRLASLPPKQVTDIRQSALDMPDSQNASPLSPQVTQPVMHRPIPAPEPNPEPNPGPDDGTPSKGISHTVMNHISDADWDQLFHAVKARLLAQCVDEALHKNAQLALLDSLAMMKAAVLECVNDLTLLHASLKIERHKCQEHQRHQQYQELEKQQQSSGRVDH